jgi:hypothetical protein
MTQIDSPEGKYVVPRGCGEGDPLIIDIAGVARATTRLQEVAIVNIQKAPELMATFNQYWQDANDAVTALTSERDAAKAALEEAEAEALLDLVQSEDPKKKKIAGSADVRKAAVAIDPRVKKANERLNEIKTVLSYVENKAKAFENGWRSVRTLTETYRTPPPQLSPTRAAPGAFGGNTVPDDPFESQMTLEGQPHKQLPPSTTDSAAMDDIFGEVNYRR